MCDPKTYEIRLPATWRRLGDPNYENILTFLIFFLIPGGPFSLTNRQISISAVRIFFSGSIAVLIASQTTTFVLSFFHFLYKILPHFNPGEVGNDGLVADCKKQYAAMGTELGCHVESDGVCNKVISKKNEIN